MQSAGASAAWPATSSLSGPDLTFASNADLEWRIDKSTLPLDFEETAGFRETSIHLLAPEHADTARRFGRMLYEIILAGDTYYGEPGESSVRRELQAAHADLVHTRDFMRYVARQIQESALQGDDARLSLFAGEMVGALDRVIDALQEGIG